MNQKAPPPPALIPDYLPAFFFSLATLLVLFPHLNPLRTVWWIDLLHNLSRFWPLVLILPAVWYGFRALPESPVKPRCFLLAFFYICLVIISMGGVYLPPPHLSTPAPTGPMLSVMSFNVQTSNPDHSRAARYMLYHEPHILVLMEINKDWATSLEILHSRYPYRHIVPREDHFGIALYSRLPLDNPRTIDPASTFVPSIETTVQWQGRPLHLIATHPLPPISQEYFKLRNHQLKTIAASIPEKKGVPTLIIGDLNSTPQSIGFAPFLHHPRLAPPSHQPTWIASFCPLGIPIDHTLHTRDILCHHSRTGPPLGSDHLPVLSFFSLPRAAGP